ncbi:MAG: LptF/LptG family permease [Candidatus Hydrogenedentes bacterium]|nr:LptF/LptG family permease [Candidatus Hydrogenedentota bacterium]
MDGILGKRLAAPARERRFGPFFGLLTRYTLWEIAVPAAMAILIIGFVGVANELRERRLVLPLEFITGWDVARLVFYFSPTLAAYIIPITYMMGILLAFGRLAENNEITAMKAAGIPLKRAIAPVIGVGLVLSGLSFFLMDRVQPWAAEKASHIIFVELPQRITLEVLPPGSVQEVGDWRVYFGSRDAETKTLNDVVIRDTRSDGEWVFYAKSAQFVDSPDGARLDLLDGRIIRPQKDETVAPLVFPKWTISVPTTFLRQAPSQRRTLSLEELLAYERDAKQQADALPTKSSVEDLRKTREEIADRITLPLACLAVSFLAAPLAVRSPRAGKSFSFALGVGIIFIFYMARALLEPSELVTINGAILRALAPSLLLMALGMVAIWRVDRV